MDPVLQGRDTLLQSRRQESFSYVDLETSPQPRHQKGSFGSCCSVFDGLFTQPVQSTRFNDLNLIPENGS
jgi:hypothetical protein